MNVESDMNIFEKLKNIGLIEPLQVCSKDTCRLRGRAVIIIKCWSAHLTISKTLTTLKLHLNTDITRQCRKFVS
jgi:hypothetical protein